MSDQEAKLDWLRILLALFIPPVAVFTQVGLQSPFWINLLLTFFGWFPGVAHAIWVILTMRSEVKIE